MNGNTLLHEVPEYVKTISQFKNSLLAEYIQYNYANLLVCYMKQGHDVMPYDDELINFNRIYYVIIKPIVCNEHSHSYSHSNNNPLIINFDDSDSDSDSESEYDTDNNDTDNNDKDDEDEDETDDEMPELVSDSESDEMSDLE